MQRAFNTCVLVFLRISLSERNEAKLYRNQQIAEHKNIYYILVVLPKIQGFFLFIERQCPKALTNSSE